MLTVHNGMRGSLRTVARELPRHKLGLVGVQEVRWDRGGTVRAGRLFFFLRKTKQKSLIGKRTFVLLYTTEQYQQLIEQSVC